jgi:hypothetical protein
MVTNEAINAHRVKKHAIGCKISCIGSISKGVLTATLAEFDTHNFGQNMIKECISNSTVLQSLPSPGRWWAVELLWLIILRKAGESYCLLTSACCPHS